MKYMNPDDRRGIAVIFFTTAFGLGLISFAAHSKPDQSDGPVITTTCLIAAAVCVVLAIVFLVWSRKPEPQSAETLPNEQPR